MAARVAAPQANGVTLTLLDADEPARHEGSRLQGAIPWAGIVRALLTPAPPASRR